MNKQTKKVIARTILGLGGGLWILDYIEKCAQIAEMPMVVAIIITIITIGIIVSVSMGFCTLLYWAFLED